MRLITLGIFIIANYSYSILYYWTAGTYLILDFDDSSPCPPVNGIRDISITDGMVVLEFIAAMLGVEDRCINLRLMVLNTHVETMVLL